MPHPFDNPAYSIRPGDRFILTREESRGLVRFMVEVSDKRYSRGDRHGLGADDIELVYLHECDGFGGHVADFEFGPLRFRVPHGVPLGAAYKAVPAAVRRAA